MFADKLQKGDEVRVIAPARSLGIISDECRKLAISRITELGLKVTFGKNVNRIDAFLTSSIEERIGDLHDAFSDRNVKAILTVIGGFSSNQLLSYIDFELIGSNPKIFCGFSDITILSNSIYAKTGLVTYSGMHFSTFGCLKEMDYAMEYFTKCMFKSDDFEVLPSKKWSDDFWFADQENRKFIDNKGYIVINKGCAKGTIIGGNLCSLSLLQGTPYMPNLENTILFIEDTDWVGNSFMSKFDRDLQSLIHQSGFDKVKGIVIGRAQKNTNFSIELMSKIIKSKKELDNIPVIYGADFGHTLPIFTFPIGGMAKIEAGEIANIRILNH